MALELFTTATIFYLNICMIPSRENILFEIELRSTFWDQPPRANISINDVCKFDGNIDQNMNAIKFYHELEFDSPQKLIINRYNKTPEQSKNGKDQIMYIGKIIIDGIDINNFIMSRATFSPVYPEPWASQQAALGIELESTLLGETCLGHNGQWRFDFTAPFWQFLIKAMN
jgi:hypothetical protein